MPIFERGAVVRVPFPYTNRPILQRRPAVVVSHSDLADGHLLWVVMVTSADNRMWPGDIALLENHAKFGLPAPSLIRPAKIATIDTMSAERIGQLTAALMARVDSELRNHLGL